MIELDAITKNKRAILVLCVRVNCSGQLLSTVGLVEKIVSQRLEVGQVRAVGSSGEPMAQVQYEDELT